MANQDWFDKDFYKALGVNPDASDGDIKKAYRKLAKDLHPDKNPDNAEAEQRFKEVSEAYSVLADAEQRKEYDAIRTMSHGGARFTAGGGGPSGFSDDVFSGFFSRQSGRQPGGSATSMDDLLAGLFTGGGGGFSTGGGFNQPARGTDVEASASLTFRQAVSGDTVTLRRADGTTVTTRVPPGVRDGQKIRLRGKGNPGAAGNGDLILTIAVEPHPVFGRDGDNLTITVPVTFDEAALGAQITVPTFEGSSVTVKLPSGTPSGRTLRVKGRGVQRKEGTSGDLLVTVSVTVPQKLDGAARDAVEAYAEATKGDDPRAGLADQARAS
ncbi:DnaJ domain-containing protein [Jatrophihabitans telluris]|uniref:DnaJ domain-containing protein n=1 Tax=Jatrophihabitans telluris TaxID=2038343 RepID=A0ABY4QYG0_9ACTN|nr:DnaJ C-terminal domain-containing protein [Jatrophihabitans telluris]UQX88322.1 DnaJ domain-containing protein [Jatrophihabitans telluris]